MAEVDVLLKGGIFGVVVNILAEILGKLLEPFNEICNKILDEYRTSVSIREQELYGIPHSRLSGTALFPFQELDEIQERIKKQSRKLDLDKQKWWKKLTNIKLFLGIMTVFILGIFTLFVLSEVVLTDVFAVKMSLDLEKILEGKILVTILIVIVLLIIIFGVRLFLQRAKDYEHRNKELRGFIEDMVIWRGHTPYVSGAPLEEPRAVRWIRKALSSLRK